jgi:hypothetical protein
LFAFGKSAAGERKMNLVASIWDTQLWYALPMMLVISIVYGATRHEHLREIVRYSVSAFIWLFTFLAVIFAIVWWATSRI